MAQNPIPKMAEIFSAPDLNNQAEDSYPLLEPVAEREYYPVSSSQKRIYYLNQLDPDSIGDNLAIMIKVSGHLDVSRLMAAFESLIYRHESFRTSFAEVDGEVVQKINPGVDFRLEEIQAGKKELKTVISGFVKPFMLNQAPLARAALVSLTADQFLILFCIHHIIADGVSINIILREIVTLYEGQTLPKLPVTYKDYVFWQKKWFATKDFGRQKVYWAAALTDTKPMLNLPLDYPRKFKTNPEGRKLQFVIPAESALKLKDLAFRKRLTLNALFFAIYGLLLSRYCNQDDLFIGSVVSGRCHPNLGNVIGTFTNTLPIRIKVKDTDTFFNFLAGVSQTVYNAYENQDVPMEQIAGFSPHHLFNTILVFHSEFDPQAQPQISALQLKGGRIDTRVATIDLLFEIYQTENAALRCWLTYDSTLYKKETILKMVNHFQVLAEQIAANPEQLLSKIELFSETEKQQVLIGFNNRAVAWENEKTNSRLLDQTGMANTTAEYVAPRNEIERLLVEIWREVLGVASVGVDDNFFDLGGDSLKAIKVIELLNGYTVNIRDILQYPTIAKLQEYVIPLMKESGSVSYPVNKNLTAEYYFFKNGERDPIVRILDCNTQILYMVFKNQVSECQKYLEFFLREFTFYIIQNPDETIYDIGFDLYPSHEDIFKIEYFESQGFETMAIIEKILDRGEPVAVSSYVSRIPFNRDFEGFDTPDVPGRRGHGFLVVAHDENHLYYVEAPELINSPYFVPYPANKSVGIIKKEDLRAAFEVYVNYATVTIDETKLNKKSVLADLIGMSLNHYYKTTDYQDGLRVSHGKEALDLLIGLAEKEILQLDSASNTYQITLYNLFCWKFWTIAAKREMLMYVLLNYQGKCNPEIRNRLLDMLAILSKEWYNADQMTIRKYNETREYLVAKNYQTIFTRLKTMEDELMENLGQLWP